MRPAIGIDTYSYHRYLGERRPGEAAAPGRWATTDVLAEVRRIGAEWCSLETCFLDPAADRATVAEAAEGGLGVSLAWGHRDGLRYGTDHAALAEARRWVRDAKHWGATLVRVVAASPWVVRPEGASVVGAVVAALDELCDVAGELGVVIALENHADLVLDELVPVLDAVPTLTVCLDTANALRVGDDPVEVATALGARLSMVHLKDVASASWDGPVGPASVGYGAGVIDVVGVLDALVDADFSGPICVELGHLGPGDVDERALVAAGVRWLREWRAGRDDAG